MNENLSEDLLLPGEEEEHDPLERNVEDGIALCLSGGGYRAMLFHVGVLWRLNELGYLPKLSRISSVSGGSITAGVLGMRWKAIDFDVRDIGQNFVEQIVSPIRAMAEHTIDLKAIFSGTLLPGTIGNKVRNAYVEHLFGEATLQDLPDTPRFVINATSLQSGALWRFSKPYMADYRVGRILNPKISLAVAVAASSAFPPLLSPVEIDLEGQQWEKADRETPDKTGLHHEPYTTDVLLSDGGVYDNMGTETAIKRYRTILVSDAGQKTKPEEDPDSNWVGQSIRVFDLVDNQVRSLRKRILMWLFTKHIREGAYWGIGTNIANYNLSDALPCSFDRTKELAQVPTRLKAMESELQERLINWGYAVCDAAMRKHVNPQLNRPKSFPYPAIGV